MFFLNWQQFCDVNSCLKHAGTGTGELIFYALISVLPFFVGKNLFLNFSNSSIVSFFQYFYLRLAHMSFHLFLLISDTLN